MDLATLSVPHLQSIDALQPALGGSAAAVDGSPLLLVSDNPETLTAAVGATGALGEFRLTGLAAPSVRLRLFFWHLNHTGADRTFGVTVHNAGATTVQIVRIVSASESGVDFLDIGRDIAQALLSGGGSVLLDAGTGGDAPRAVEPGQTAVLRSLPWPKNHLIGGEIEITLESADAEPPDVIVRTVCGPNPASLANASAPLIDAAQPHPYGVWPFSAVAIDTSLTVDASSRRGFLRLGADGPFTVEAALPGSVPAGRKVRANRAGYGAVFGPIRVALTNAGSVPVAVRALLVPRGGTFAGAVVLPDGSVRTVPTLAAQVEAADLGTLTVPPGATLTPEYVVAIAGAASAPIALFFEAV